MLRGVQITECINDSEKMIHTDMLTLFIVVSGISDEFLCSNNVQNILLTPKSVYKVGIWGVFFSSIFTCILLYFLI